MNVSAPPSAPPFSSALYASLLALLLLPAALGNLALLLTRFWGRGQDWAGLRGPGSAFTLSLSLSDLALSLSVIPGAVYCAAAAIQQVEAKSTWCQASGFLLVLLLTSSLLSRTLMAVGQYSELRHALSNGRSWTAWRIRLLLLFLWAYSGVYASLPVVGVGRFRFSSASSLCGLSLTDADAVSRAVSLSWLTVSMATPLTLTCTLQGYAVHVARRQARRGTFRCNELHCYYVPARVYERSSRAFILSTGALLLCWAPYIGLSLFEALTLTEAPPWASQSSMFLVLSSSAFSPGVTALTQPQYRAAARLLMLRLRRLVDCPNPAPSVDTANPITPTPLPGAAHTAMTTDP